MHRSSPLFFAVLLPVLSSPVLAQEPPPPAPVSASADPDRVLAQINDLGLLRALVPLKLTDDQRSRLLVILRQIAEEAKTRTRQDADVLRALAADVERARAGALAGSAIPAELETRVGEAAKTVDARGKRARSEALRRILLVAKEVLTVAQRDEIETQSQRANGGKLVPRQYQADPSKAPREAILDLATASFIERVLLNARAIEVLSQMKTPIAAPPAAE